WPTRPPRTTPRPAPRPGRRTGLVLPQPRCAGTAGQTPRGVGHAHGADLGPFGRDRHHAPLTGGLRTAGGDRPRRPRRRLPRPPAVAQPHRGPEVDPGRPTGVGPGGGAVSPGSRGGGPAGAPEHRPDLRDRRVPGAAFLLHETGERRQPGWG